MIHNPADPVLLAHGLLQDPGAVPLVIAVAGHRDPRPEYVPLLRQNFLQQLEQLINALPHTPLVMLNGLAEGMSLPRFQGQCLESCFYTDPIKTNDRNEWPVYATPLQR